ncbi:unnamed protein product [Angiostrongylus costaricensis]|uniref:DUF775 domain-containing protein n=1 Tax=Angiostrongylus costaricensis TaxID=334426 RepID=A0A0R3PUN9_ANGCS|nr:unnamed protein product [Angiostrongylus costaricensis]
MNEVFGLIAAGRAPSHFVQVGEREFLCEIENASGVNHVVVFMTGLHPFPDGLGGSGKEMFRVDYVVFIPVYVRWPSAEVQDTGWNYLGFISNVKPSVIFKILHLSEVRHTGIFSDGMSVSAIGSVQVGLMVEPLAAIEGREAADGTQASQQSTLGEFAETVLRHLVNHVESYTTRLARSDGFADYIPVSALQEWYNNFRRRFEQNPYFWRSIRNT